MDVSHVHGGVEVSDFLAFLFVFVEFEVEFSCEDRYSEDVVLIEILSFFGFEFYVVEISLLFLQILINFAIECQITVSLIRDLAAHCVDGFSHTIEN